MTSQRGVFLSILVVAFCLITKTVDAKAVEKEFCATKAEGLYPDPASCKFFYSCANGITNRMPCVASLYFDPDKNICNWPSEVSAARKLECQRLEDSSNSTSTTTTTTSTTTTESPRTPKKDQSTKEPSFNNKMPKSMELRFNMGSKSVSFNINQKPQSDPDSQNPPRVITSFRGRRTEHTSDETFALYENPDNKASMVVSKNPKKGNAFAYRGNFQVDEKRYVIEPRGAANIYPVMPSDITITYNGSEYMISERQNAPPTCPTERAARSSGNDSSTTATPSFAGAVMYDSAPAAASATSKQHYGIELLAVIDYSIFNKFYMQSTSTTSQGRTNDAVQNIRYYMAHIVNGMDNRYSTVNQSDFDMYVRLTGYFIAQTPYDSPWTEGYGIKYDGIYSDAYKALDAFEDWTIKNAPYLPIFDSAMLFTSNLPFYFRTDGSKGIISGLANIAASCTPYKVGLTYEFGEYSTIETAAHELGHNLGAQHDNLGINSCDGALQYIMASAPGYLTNATYKNPFRFSTCSIAYFRQYTNQLNSQNTNCLLNEAANAEPGDTANFLRTYPGQRYNPDVQCQMLYGSNSYYCAGGSRDIGICRQMQCWSPDDQMCYATVEQRAFDGTTCANGSWCYMGDCVQNSMAPSAPLSCIYGDYRGTYSINNQIYTCQQIGYYQPYRCYDSGYSVDCCTTCTRIKDNSRPGCEYGDREPDWCRTSLRSFDCYDPTVRTRCCSTCTQYYRNVTGCEYGDRDNSWCPSVSAAQCYSSSSTCCISCRRYYTGIQGCEYGDKTSGCYQYSTSYCLSDSNFAASCCGTCNAAYPKTTLSTTMPTTTTTRTTTTTTTRPPTPATSPPPPAQNNSCPLGDAADYCTTMNKFDCYLQYNRTCCVTCPKYYNASRPGCEYGDKVPWCATYVQGPAECQNVKDDCCLTCERYTTGSPNVITTTQQPECTDKADWCPTMFHGFCYNSDVLSTCCASCKNYATGQPNCPYGDMFEWCDPIYCDRNSKECCTKCP